MWPVWEICSFPNLSAVLTKHSTAERVQPNTLEKMNAAPKTAGDARLVFKKEQTETTEFSFS